MKNISRLSWDLFLCSLLLFLATACATSMHLGGGTNVSSGDQGIKTIVSYRAEVKDPKANLKGITYHLVETERGESIFERSSDGSGVLYESHWRDKLGDHFACWVKSGWYDAGAMVAYEVVIPTDRKRRGELYVHPRSNFELETIDGIKRPVPKTSVAPTAVLIPE